MASETTSSGELSAKSRAAPARSVTVLDGVIGHNLRLLRMSRGVSQNALAEEFGITFQQVQKYEKGVNRLPASRLYEIARFFEVDLRIFFKDPREPLGGPSDLADTIIETTTINDLKLITAVRSLPDDQRRLMTQLVESISPRTEH